MEKGGKPDPRLGGDLNLYGAPYGDHERPAHLSHLCVTKGGHLLGQHGLPRFTQVVKADRTGVGHPVLFADHDLGWDPTDAPGDRSDSDSFQDRNRRVSGKN